jgi:hypothetical protein
LILIKLDIRSKHPPEDFAFNDAPPSANSMTATTA